MHPERERHSRNIDAMEIRKRAKNTDFQCVLRLELRYQKGLIARTLRIRKKPYATDPTSRAYATSKYIMDELKERVIKERDDAECLLDMDFYDGFAYGLNFVGGAIVIANKQLRGVAEEYFEEEHQEAKDPRTLLDIIYETHYAETAAHVFKAEIDFLAEQTPKGQAPTGFPLVRQLTREVIEGRWDKSFERQGLVVPFVRKGSKFARQVYAMLFPLSADLHPAA